MTNLNNLAAPAAVVLDHLTVRIGDRKLLNDVSLTIPAGKLSAIIGGSGAGKSVLLRLIAGLPTDHSPIMTEGEIRIADPAVKITRLIVEWGLSFRASRCSMNGMQRTMFVLHSIIAAIGWFLRFKV